MSTYTAQLDAILNGRPMPTKSRLIHNAKILATEADTWREAAESGKRQAVTMTAHCDKYSHVVQEIVANSQDRAERLAARLGLANLADGPEPDPDAPPRKGEMH